MIGCYGSEVLEQSVPEFGAEVFRECGDMKGLQPNKSRQPTPGIALRQAGRQCFGVAALGRYMAYECRRSAR